MNLLKLVAAFLGIAALLGLDDARAECKSAPRYTYDTGVACRNKTKKYQAEICQAKDFLHDLENVKKNAQEVLYALRLEIEDTDNILVQRHILDNQGQSAWEHWITRTRLQSLTRQANVLPAYQASSAASLQAIVRNQLQRRNLFRAIEAIELNAHHICSSIQATAVARQAFNAYLGYLAFLRDPSRVGAANVDYCGGQGVAERAPQPAVGHALAKARQLRDDLTILACNLCIGNEGGCRHCGEGETCEPNITRKYISYRLLNDGSLEHFRKTYEAIKKGEVNAAINTLKEENLVARRYVQDAMNRSFAALIGLQNAQILRAKQIVSTATAESFRATELLNAVRSPAALADAIKGAEEDSAAIGRDIYCGETLAISAILEVDALAGEKNKFFTLARSRISEIGWGAIMATCLAQYSNL